MAPYRVCLIHGGPGAPGTLAPLARVLSGDTGILEPFQTAGSIKGQLEELDNIIGKAADMPVILIGHSWGAWLSLLYTADFPGKVIKLIMISSGAFTEEYASQVSQTRISRLSQREKTKLGTLEQALIDPFYTDKNGLMREYSILMHKTDSYDPLPFQDNCIAYQPDILLSVWAEAEEMRKEGSLIAKADAVACPVVIFHGDYDPHPWQGVVGPIKDRIKNVRYFLLKKCGHEPWQEKHARNEFFTLLKQEILL